MLQWPNLRSRSDDHSCVRPRGPRKPTLAGGLSPDSFRAGPAMEGMGPGCVNTTIPVSMCAVPNCFPLCKRDGVCPRFARLNRHNHLSEVLAFNTPDEYLGREILEGIRILQSLLSPRRLRVDAVLAAALRHASGRA